MANKQKTAKGRKVGRNKRAVDQKMSNFVKGRITFEQYKKGQ